MHLHEIVTVVVGRAPDMDATDSDCGLMTGESMAETQTEADLATAHADNTDVTNWVQDDVLRNASEYTSRDSIERFKNILSSMNKCAVVEPCATGELVCYRPPNPSIDRFTFVYETMLTKLGVRFPLLTFECEVLQYLNIAPTELHPNGWGFVRAFAILKRGMESTPSIGRLFYFHQAKSHPKVGWKSINKQLRRGILSALTQSYKDFKTKFFRVRAGDKCPFLLVDREGKERFPLYWTKGPLAK